MVVMCVWHIRKKMVLESTCQAKKTTRPYWRSNSTKTNPASADPPCGSMRFLHWAFRCYLLPSAPCSPFPASCNCRVALRTSPRHVDHSQHSIDIGGESRNINRGPNNNQKPDRSRFHSLCFFAEQTQNQTKKRAPFWQRNKSGLQSKSRHVGA